MKLFARLILLLLCLTVWPISGQTELTSAPVKWEQYNVSERNFAIDFPKMPVRFGGSVSCSNIEIRDYYSYASDAVYRLRTTTKVEQNNSSECRKITKFNRSYFEKRLSELGIVKPKIEPKSPTGNESESPVYSSKGKLWVIADLKNERWFEISVTSRIGTKTDEVRFIKSLKTDLASEGVEIGGGATHTVGDDIDILPPISYKNPSTSVTGDAPPIGNDTLTIVKKPPAAFTEEARQSQIQGTVILRLTFQNNGAIANIVPVKGLPLGLTDSSISAAKKIIFLPQRMNGQNVSVTKQVEYTFSLY